VVAFSNHISRKNAIIAVMKSAYATFQAPPWWTPSSPSSRLITISALSSARRFLRIAGYHPKSQAIMRLRS